MIEVRFTVASAEELQAQLNRISMMVSGVQTLAPEPQRESLALYTVDELQEELAGRGAALQPSGAAAAEPAAAPASEPAKKKAGRPPKLQAVAPAPAPAQSQPEANPFEEPKPDPAAVVAAGTPETPSQEAGTISQNLPSVEQMMKLMTQLYAKCKDILLVRSIAEEVCGKVNLAECPPEKFPELKARLEAKLREYEAPKGAAA